MPMYEGIGLISEKHAAVLDIGIVYTKCGFAGETGPRCIIPTEIYRGKIGKTVKLIDNLNPVELYRFFVDFIHHLYFKHLLVNPKDRRVVIVESVLSPTEFRETLAKVLFVHYEVSSLLFVPSHLMTLFTLGVSSGMVLDFGHKECQIFPLYEGIVLLNSGETVPLAAKAIYKSLENLLIKFGTIRLHNKQVPVSDICTSFSNSVLEDITVRTCFVTTYERGQQIQAAKRVSSVGDKYPKPPPDVEYMMDGDKILQIPGTVREQAAEVLFELDNDMQSIASLLLDTILKCPIDLRRVLADNIIVTGGTAMMPGLKARLKAELHALLAHPKYCNRLAIKTFKFHRPPAKDNYTAWLGAAIFAATDIVASRSLTKEQYLREECMPDWSNLKFFLNEKNTEM